MFPLDTLVEDLLLGRDLDRDAWRELEQQLAPARGGDEPPEVTGLRILCRIIATDTPGELDSLVASIPPGQHGLALLAPAAAAARRLDAADAASLTRFVASAHELLPHLGAQDQLRPAVERLATLQGRAIDLGGDPVDPAAACAFIVHANMLARLMETPAFLEPALAVLDRVRRGPASAGRFLAMNNAVVTFKQLAKYRPREAALFISRGVELVTGLYEVHAEVARAVGDPNAARIMPAAWLSNLLYWELEMAKHEPAHAEAHLSAAWRHLAEFRRFADEVGDPDLHRAADEAEATLRGDSVLDESSLGAEAMLALLERSSQGEAEAALRIRELGEPAAREQAMAEHLRRRYAELSAALQPVVEEVGINRHVSRLLLSLGALAGGRLWPLASPAVQGYVLRSPPDRDGPSHAEQVQRSQDRPSRRFFAREPSYPALLCGLAAFCDGLSFDESLREPLRARLRDENRELLRRVVPSIRPQRIASRKMAPADDLAAIAALAGRFGAPPS